MKKAVFLLVGQLNTSMYMERFKLEQVEGLANHYIVEDIQSGILCMFEKGKFNETQKFTNLPKTDIMRVPTIMRELGDWLRENHYDKIF